MRRELTYPIKEPILEEADIGSIKGGLLKSMVDVINSSFLERNGINSFSSYSIKF